MSFTSAEIDDLGLSDGPAYLNAPQNQVVHSSGKRTWLWIILSVFLVGIIIGGFVYCGLAIKSLEDKIAGYAKDEEAYKKELDNYLKDQKCSNKGTDVTTKIMDLGSCFNRYMEMAEKEFGYVEEEKYTKT